jgi:hypothetical protein
MKTFKAMDLKNGCCVNNLIYASIFWDADTEKMNNIITGLEKDNSDWQFKLKKTN